MESKEIQLVLENISPFNKLDKQSLNKFLALAEVRLYRHNELVYRENEDPGFLYVLLKGRVAVSVFTEGRPRQIEILKRGTCFGIISLLTESAHSVTAGSIENSEILLIDKDRFKDFLKQEPLFSLEFSRILSQRVQARSKPKQIFQSKKIAVLAAFTMPVQDYLVDLGMAIAQQTAKRCICVKNATNSAVAQTALPLENFQENSLADFILHEKADLLFIKGDSPENFLSLLNYLSENYHFVLYEVTAAGAQEAYEVFIGPCRELHLLISLDEQQQAREFLEALKTKNPLDEDKIKIVVAESSPRDDSGQAVLSLPVYVVLPPQDSEIYAKALRRVSRQIGEVTVGLALGSGAAYGYSHIGVLKVLAEHNIAIDIICGSSMGSIIATLWAAGFSLADIQRHSLELGRKLGSFAFTGFSFPFKGIMKSRRLENIFRKVFADLTFHDLKHTLKIVAFDFVKRKTVVLESGPLYKALAASCAFPGFFEPVRFQKDMLLDGGILNPLPTKILLEFAAHKIIASNITLSEEEALRHYQRRKALHVFDFVFGSIETMQQQFVQQALKIADVVIHPHLEGLGWLAFDDMTEFIRRGEAAAQEKLDEIKRLVLNLSG